MILLATYYLLLSIITIAIVHVQGEWEGFVLQEVTYRISLVEISYVI